MFFRRSNIGFGTSESGVRGLVSGSLASEGLASGGLASGSLASVGLAEEVNEQDREPLVTLLIHGWFLVP